MGGQGGVVGGVVNEGYLVYVKGLSTDDGIMHIAQHCAHTPRLIYYPKIG